MRSTETVWWRAPAYWCLVGLAIIALGDAAIRLAPAGTHVAAWWPAAGLAVAAGVRAGPHGVRWAVLTTFLASVVANLLGDRPAEVAALFALANATEVAVVCTLVLRWNPSRSLRSIAQLTQIVAAATIGAAIAGALAGMTVMTQVDDGLWLNFRAVGSSHLAAVLLFLPFALASHHRRQASIAEKAATAVALVGAALFLFRPDQHLPMVFVLFPLLVFTAFRQSLQACAVHLILVNLTVAVASSAGWGPLVLATRRAGMPPETTGTMIAVLIITTAVMVYALRITVESRQDAHASAMRSRQHLQAVIESASSTAIIETDLDGVIQVFNQGAVNMLGYAEADVVGQHTPALFHDPDEMAARAAELGIAPGFEVFVREVRGPQRTAERRDWTYITADGRRRRVSLVVSRVDDADGYPIGFLGIAEDVGAQRKVETLLVQALEHERSLASRLREADALKADFVSSVSHELRTPMTSVLGYAEILADLYGDSLGPEGSVIVGRILSNGERLLNLVDGLLTLSRNDSENLELAREPVDVRVVARNAVAVLQPLALTNDIRVFLVEPWKPELVLGDPAEIERVVINLLSNAIKFTTGGGQITLGFADDDPDTTTLTVTDTGVGIPPDELEHVFDRFHRASNAVASTAPGTGLGLAIVKSIVERHEGCVEVSSQLHQGTTFSVRLPRFTGSSGASELPRAMEPQLLGAAVPANRASSQV